jgi:hypothetical protein
MVDSPISGLQRNSHALGDDLFHTDFEEAQTYTLTLTDPQTKQLIHDQGSFVTTYRKHPDETWKAVTDVATSEVPPPVPPSSHT